MYIKRDLFLMITKDCELVYIIMMYIIIIIIIDHYYFRYVDNCGLRLVYYNFVSRDPGSWTYYNNNIEPKIHVMCTTVI